MITRKIFPGLFFLICFLLTSCKENLNRSAYIQWVHNYENGLHVKKSFSEFIFDLQYQPADYIAVLNNDLSFSENQNVDYYTLKVNLTDPSLDIINYNIENSSEKQRKIYYFSYLFQNDIYLEEEGRKKPCVLFHFEQSDLTKGRTFVLGFEKAESNKTAKETKFVIDSPYFSSLPIKITVSKESIPTLKI